MLETFKIEKTILKEKIKAAQCEKEKPIDNHKTQISNLQQDEIILDSKVKGLLKSDALAKKEYEKIKQNLKNKNKEIEWAAINFIQKKSDFE